MAEASSSAINFPSPTAPPRTTVTVTVTYWQSKNAIHTSGHDQVVAEWPDCAIISTWPTEGLRELRWTYRRAWTSSIHHPQYLDSSSGPRSRSPRWQGVPEPVGTPADHDPSPCTIVMPNFTPTTIDGGTARGPSGGPFNLEKRSIFNPLTVDRQHLSLCARRL